MSKSDPHPIIFHIVKTTSRSQKAAAPEKRPYSQALLLEIKKEEPVSEIDRSDQTPPSTHHLKEPNYAYPVPLSASKMPPNLWVVLQPLPKVDPPEDRQS